MTFLKTFTSKNHIITWNMYNNLTSFQREIVGHTYNDLFEKTKNRALVSELLTPRYQILKQGLIQYYLQCARRVKIKLTQQ